MTWITGNAERDVLAVQDERTEEMMAAIGAPAQTRLTIDVDTRSTISFRAGGVPVACAMSK
jgi:hypothetical protein